MIMMKPNEVEGHQVISIEVALPKTTLLAITTDHGYIMCGALDIRLLNEKLHDRRIVAGRATGVRTVEQLLDAPLDMVTLEAVLRGIRPGMKGSDAFLKMVNEGRSF